MLAVLAVTLVIIGLVSTIAYMIMVGRDARIGPFSRRYADREARRSAAEEQARVMPDHGNKVEEPDPNDPRVGKAVGLGEINHDESHKPRVARA